MKLLLIDDDAFLRDMYAIKFAENGHEVQAADSAMNALNIIEAQPDFDVILFDMIMPAMSGIELMKEIDRQFPDLNAKHIVLSNHGQADDMEDAKKAGAVGYIIKAEAVPSDVVKKVEDIAKN